MISTYFLLPGEEKGFKCGEFGEEGVLDGGVDVDQSQSDPITALHVTTQLVRSG